VELKTIDQMFAFVVIDENGDEGIPAISMGPWFMAMVGADMDRIDSLMPEAQQICNLSGKPMKIVRFSQIEQIGEVNPR
jgi:hypothetical protein